MGENGAGKSTLMKILIGAHRADSGTIRFNGEDLEPSTLTVHQALGKGISMIFQELCLVPDMSVAENIFIGREPKIGKTGIVDRKKLIRQTQELLDSFEITFLRPTDSLRGMSTAKMQMIEICKALSYHSKLIIMDEPTSSLTEDECKTLFRIVERLKRDGITFIFISHKMDEIYTVADEMTVLRDGMTIDCKPVNEMPMQELISKMVGREISTFFPPRDSQCGEKLLEVRGLTKAGKFQDISFSVHRGEILGFAGLVGAGRTEIMEALFGYNPADSGDIWLKGEQVKITRPRDAINRGMVMVTVLLGMLFWWTITEGGLTVRQLTLFFSTFVFLQFWNMFNAKGFETRHSVFTCLGGCREFFLILLAIGVGQVLIVEFGGEVFRTVPLTWGEWAEVIGFTSLLAIGGELIRAIRRKK